MQGSWDLAAVRAAALGEIGTAAAATADELAGLAEQGAGVKIQVGGAGKDQVALLLGHAGPQQDGSLRVGDQPMGQELELVGCAADQVSLDDTEVAQPSGSMPQRAGLGIEKRVMSAAQVTAGLTQLVVKAADRFGQLPIADAQVAGHVQEQSVLGPIVG